MYLSISFRECEPDMIYRWRHIVSWWQYCTADGRCGWHLLWSHCKRIRDVDEKEEGEKSDSKRLLSLRKGAFRQEGQTWEWSCGWEGVYSTLGIFVGFTFIFLLFLFELAPKLTPLSGVRHQISIQNRSYFWGLYYY